MAISRALVYRARELYKEVSLIRAGGRQMKKRESETDGVDCWQLHHLGKDYPDPVRDKPDGHCDSVLTI